MIVPYNHQANDQKRKIPNSLLLSSNQKIPPQPSRFYKEQITPAMNQTSNQSKDQSVGRKIVNYFNEYCSNSTLHGLRYVGDKQLSLWERLFWLISFLVAICFAVYFITSLFDKFNQSPVIVAFNPKVVLLNEIPFPAITICNVNTALRSKALSIINSNNELDKALLNDMCDIDAINVSQSVLDDPGASDWSTVRKFIIQINQKCSSMLKVCEWEGNAQNCSRMLNSVLTDEGYCCSFNRLPLNYSLRDNIDEPIASYFPSTIIDWNPEKGYEADSPKDTYPYRSFGRGTELGLTLVLDAQLEEYYCSSTSSTGFKILFSNPLENPRVADISFLLSAGDETRVTIDPQIKDATEGVRGIAVEKRQCFFAQERFLKFYRIYTETNCRLECQANFTLDRCQCVPYYLPKNSDTPICGKKQELCSDAAQEIVQRFSPERIACNCLPSCVEIAYNLQSATVGKIITSHRTVQPQYMPPNTTHEYFATNIAVVHFYFNTDKFVKETKSELYGFSEFLSNTGGLLGLFLGFSFLSAIEALYFLTFRALCVKIRDRHHLRRENDKNNKSQGKITYLR